MNIIYVKALGFTRPKFVLPWQIKQGQHNKLLCVIQIHKRGINKLIKTS